MMTTKYTYWWDGNMVLGYLEEFPDYITQCETLEELQENLKDLYKELTGNKIPGARRVGELHIE